jgi:hypothetical protein
MKIFWTNKRLTHIKIFQFTKIETICIIGRHAPNSNCSSRFDPNSSSSSSRSSSIWEFEFEFEFEY